MYYKFHGTSERLLLLHGALSTIDTRFGAARPSLSNARRVIAVEE
jgi:hypothetical protein